MAGAGYKLFATGDVLTAAQVNTYLNEQTVMVFASSAARTSALSGVLAEGMMSYLQDTNAVQVYNGTAWVSVGGSSPLTTKGDIYTFSTVDTRLGVGANGTVLTADSAEATGLKWATAAGGGSLVFINKTTATNAATVSLDSVFSATYSNYLVIFNGKNTGAALIELKGNFRSSASTNTTANYTSQQIAGSGNTVSGDSTGNATAFRRFGYILHNESATSWIITNPFQTAHTGFSYSTQGTNNFYSGTGRFTDTTSFDGIIIADNDALQNLTGTLFVYGIKES